MAVCRGVGWQELVRPAVVPGGQDRRVGQQPCQIAVRIQPTFFRCFNHAVDHGAALCAPRRVGKQEVLPANHKGLYGAFGKVVAQLQPSVLQHTGQIRPLFLQISCRAWYTFKTTKSSLENFRRPASSSISTTAFSLGPSHITRSFTCASAPSSASSDLRS